jgi:exodeoxyribonuclease VII large subunit
MTESILAAPGAADTSRLNLPEYSVAELSAAVKRNLEQGFSYVRVRGEVSGFKRHGSGHCYLSLKDTDAVLDAVIWRPVAQRMSLKPEDGLEVVCTGRITTYASRSKYQLVIESMELAGVGALLKMLEERRKRLAAEGLFDESRKRPLPYLPEVIGVVTSPTGAVIRDILHRLADRFPRRVLLWPVAVQGEGAAEQVAAAIEGFNRLPEAGPVPRPDLIIVARGGGSLEDLMAFNEEIVVRAVAASRIPLISAVGHETDTTLIDYASDRRAPTPSAAAEMAVPVRLELLSQVGDAGGRMVGAMLRLMDERRLRIAGLARGLPDPRSLLEAAAQRLDDRTERLGNGLLQFTRVKRDRLSALGDRLRLDALRQQLQLAAERLAAFPERMAHAVRRAFEREQQHIAALGGRLESHRQAIRNVLTRGYVLVWGPDGRVVVSADAIPPGARLGLQFHDGKAEVVAEGPRKRKPKAAGESSQGELL